MNDTQTKIVFGLLFDYANKIVKNANSNLSQLDPSAVAIDAFLAFQKRPSGYESLFSVGHETELQGVLRTFVQETVLTLAPQQSLDNLEAYSVRRPEERIEDNGKHESGFPDDVDAFRVRIPSSGYLKTCWLLLWNTIRHPFQTTAIDLMTGRVIGRK